MSQISKFATGQTPPVETLTGNVGGAVGPTGGNINIVGAGSITVTGNPGTSTLTITDASAAAIMTITGDTGGAVGPDGGGDIDILAQPTAGTTVVIAGTPGSNLLELNVTDADGNTHVGLGAGNLPTTGDNNTSLGQNSLAALSSGSNNTGVGNGCLASVTTGVDNTALGYQAGVLIAGGNTNTAVGFSALSTGVTISGCTAVGSAALQVNTANDNVAVGEASLATNSTGTQNVAVGSSSAGSITTGSNNVSIGYQSMQSAASKTGTDNTAIGRRALQNTTSGSFNIAIGSSAGSSAATTASSNILIANAGATENNTIRIGTTGAGSGQQNRCFIAGIDGVNVGSVATVVTESGTQLGTAVITAGDGIAITPGANSITVSETGINTSKPAFSAFLNTTQSNVTGDGTAATLICDVELFDQGANYNNATGVFTAPATGRYFFTGACQADGIVLQTACFIQVVATSHTFTSNLVSPTTIVVATQFGLQISAMVDMTMGDTCSIVITYSGSTKTVNFVSSSSFSGYLVC